MFSARTAWQSTLSDPAAPSVIDLTDSNPTACGLAPDSPALLDSLRHPDGLLYRPDARGLEPAREAVAAYYRARGVSLEAEQVLLTAGTSEAYAHLFQLLCDPGDEVLAPAPSYPLFDLLAGLCEVRLRNYSSYYEDGWQLDWAGLEAALTPRTRALLLVHPNNPTGRYCHAAEWDRLQDLAAQRGLAVVVDEVFFDYPAPGQAAPSLPYTNAPALTFVLNGLSKTVALPQMKLAWTAVFGPLALRRAALDRLEIINDTFLSASTPIQLAAPAWLAARGPVQAGIRRRIAANLDQLDRALRQVPALTRLAIEGGWSAILRLPHTRDDAAWVRHLLAHGVLTHPGHFYSLPREAHLVISLIVPPERFAAGLERLISGGNSSAGRVN